MGKPRRLSKAFLTKERNRLYRYREAVRSLYENKTTRQDLEALEDFDIPCKLQLNDHVLGNY